MTHTATRISITTEKLIRDGVIRIIEEAGARGYFVFEGGGKGESIHHTQQRASVVGDFALVKIEVVLNDRAIAEAIAEKVAETYFGNYSGITYLDTVEILRPQKFATKTVENA